MESQLNRGVLSSEEEGREVRMSDGDRLREREILGRAVDDMGDWIKDLPASSEWRWGLLGIRREMALSVGVPLARLADSAGRATTAPPEPLASRLAPRNRAQLSAIAAAGPSRA